MSTSPHLLGFLSTNTLDDLISECRRINTFERNSQLNDKGFVDSGCSRHMTGNIAHLSDFKDFDGGYVTFGGGAHGGRITGTDQIGCNRQFEWMLHICGDALHPKNYLSTGSREVSTALPEVNTATPEDLVGPSPASEDSHVSYVQTRRMKTSYSERGFLSRCVRWVEAMPEELSSVQTAKGLDSVDLPKGHRAIGTKWVYRNKKDERGIVIRNKARLVAQGSYLMEEGHRLCFMSLLIGCKSAFLDGQIDRGDLEKPLVQDGDAADVDEHLYRILIRTLCYSSIASRPDIMFAVCACDKWPLLNLRPEYGAAASCCGTVSVLPDDCGSWIDLRWFIQICLDMQRNQLQQHSRTYPVPSLSNKVFNNYGRGPVQRDILGRKLLYSPTMLDVTEPSTYPSSNQHLSLFHSP
ncbi:putative ribonuclease H-like domain-containing protein [Tanacetum coccineum]